MGVSIMKIDLGDKCVHCKKDTSLGSGNFLLIAIQFLILTHSVLVMNLLVIVAMNVNLKWKRSLND
jgi:hypothetical protein